jgi:hypothetical protein
VSTAVHPAASAENAWAGQGAVLLDIGGDVGALVVTMPSSTVGLEVEIRPLDRHDHRHTPGSAHDHGGGHLAHVAVVSRPVGDRRVPSIVFGDLVEGRYELFEKGRPDAVRLRVHVVGGHVTSAAWPD